MTVLRAIVTAGGTREPIDAVRHVSNVASGALPAAIANCLLKRGFIVDYIHGPGAILPATAQVALNVLELGESELALATADFSARAHQLRRDVSPENCFCTRFKRPPNCMQHLALCVTTVSRL